MTDNAQNILALNIALFIVVVIALGLMVMWSRATRGVWPGRRKFLLLAGVNLLIWFGANILYFYFRSHP